MRAFSSMATAVPLTPTGTARLDLFNVFDWDVATEVDELADEESGVDSPNASTSVMSLSHPPCPAPRLNRVDNHTCWTQRRSIHRNGIHSAVAPTPRMPPYPFNGPYSLRYQAENPVTAPS